MRKILFYAVFSGAVLMCSSCEQIQISLDVIKADAAYNHGNYSRAIEIYKDLIQKSPDDAGLYHKLGIAYYSSGNKLEVQKQIAKLRTLGKSALADDLQQIIDR